MTDCELIEAVAAALRAYATDPLASCEVHEWAQAGYEDADGSVTVDIEDAMQAHVSIGDASQNIRDTVQLSIVGAIPHADTQTNRRNIEALRRQIMSILRSNRTIAGGGEAAITNAREPLSWTYGLGAFGTDERLHRTCTVLVAYDKHPDDAD